MPLNGTSRVAVRDLSPQSRGEFQLHEPVDLIPLAPRLLASRRGIFVAGGTPMSPGKDFALATLSWLSPIRRLACGRPSSVGYYAGTDRFEAHQPYPYNCQ